MSKFTPSLIFIGISSRWLGFEQALKKMIVRINEKIFIVKNYHDLDEKKKISSFKFDDAWNNPIYSLDIESAEVFKL